MRSGGSLSRIGEGAGPSDSDGARGEEGDDGGGDGEEGGDEEDEEDDVMAMGSSKRIRTKQEQYNVRGGAVKVGVRPVIPGRAPRNDGEGATGRTARRWVMGFTGSG
jgi:hypothetical protein